MWFIRRGDVNGNQRINIKRVQATQRLKDKNEWQTTHCIYPGLDRRKSYQEYKEVFMMTDESELFNYICNGCGKEIPLGTEIQKDDGEYFCQGCADKGYNDYQ